MTREPGTTCRLRVLSWHASAGEPDLGPDLEGDFLRTRRGRCYRIDRVKLCRPGSKALAVLHVTRLKRDAVADGQAGVWRWTFGAR